ncbi:endo-1,4-beta-xylanase [Sphingomonas sp. BK580]|uniref:endo-1,4-beta-xylanase n=1 Tax=Sphingomonas sp. BK580 TaxID=2586972 RepID=UPI00160D9E1D|nr:endo-1,4-beta-xylanase [Sphingomonas sp. BK580]MBB3693320.1 endo-1,4-beta-xylanase [Sphingomonas sp. BK580]
MDWSPTRREGLAALAAALTAGPAMSASGASGLDAVARRRGRRFGSALSSRPRGASPDNPRYAALLRADCGVLVAENETKWQHLRPTPDQFDFAAFDRIADYAARAHMALRGHNLLWQRRKWMPRWLEAHDFGARPAAEAERILREHIATVTRRYGTRITSYDVVNEAVTPETGALEETALSQALGGTEATLDLAFHTARAGAPHAELVYNDYMSWEPGNAAHRAGVLRLLEGFRKRGTPVDALGLQSHIVTAGSDTAASARAYEGEWRHFLDAVTAMGYRLLITEFDVRDNGLPAEVAARDRGVADYARRYLDVTLSYPGLRDVLAWGLSDRFSWIGPFEPRPDKAPRRPCPYDVDYRPKPLHAAIARALAEAPRRA